MSPQNIEYEGRHRDESDEALKRCHQREATNLNVKIYNGLYEPRHSSARREQVSA